MSVVIGAVERPYGILGAYSRTGRGFTPEEARFAQTVASVLAAKKQKSKKLRQAGDSRLPRNSIPLGRL